MGGAAAVKVGRRPSITVYFTVYLHVFSFSGKNRLFFSAWPFLLTARFPRIYAGFRVSPAAVFALRNIRCIPQTFGCAIPQTFGCYSPNIWVLFPKHLGALFLVSPKNLGLYSQNIRGVFLKVLWSFLPNFYNCGVGCLAFSAGVKVFYKSLAAGVVHSAPVFQNI